jgi:hypothetical protein
MIHLSGKGVYLESSKRSARILPPVLAKETSMSTAIERLQAAQQRAMAGRPKVGGFPCARKARMKWATASDLGRSYLENSLARKSAKIPSGESFRPCLTGAVSRGAPIKIRRVPTHQLQGIIFGAIGCTSLSLKFVSRTGSDTKNRST